MLLIQYGRHDMDRENLACYSDPETEFAGYLERYVNVARNNRATPVFLIPALSGSGAWKESCCKLGKRLNVECVILPGQEGENPRAEGGASDCQKSQAFSRSNLPSARLSSYRTALPVGRGIFRSKMQFCHGDRA